MNFGFSCCIYIKHIHDQIHKMAILSIAMPDVQINPMNIAVINLADEAKLFHFVLIKFSQISPSSAKLITAIFIGFIRTPGS